MPGFAVDWLRAHRAKQLEERVRLGKVWGDPSLVFTTELGTPIDGRNLLRLYKKRLRAAGLDSDSFNFHGPRHSAATLALAAGTLAGIVGETPGHSRIAATFDTYSHVLPHLQDEAAARMDALLGKAV